MIDGWYRVSGGARLQVLGDPSIVLLWIVWISGFRERKGDVMNDTARTSQVARFAIPAIAMALAAMLCLTMGAGTAWAGGGKDISAFKGKVTSVYMKKGDLDAYGDYKNYDKNPKKITAVKSSNKKVATAKVVSFSYDGGSFSYILITKKKAGTTKITYTMAGKTKTVTYRVVKWKNPVKTFKVGSKNYASKFKKKASVPGTGDLVGQTVKVKAAKGWKVQKIYVYTDTGSVKNVKNGKKLPSGTHQVMVQLKNKSTKAVEVVTVYAN